MLVDVIDDDDVFGVFDDFATELWQEEEGNDLSSSSLSTDSDSSGQRAPVRRRWPKRNRSLPPRVVKNDIRRHYGTMLMNVFNTNCKTFQDNFIDTFTIPCFRTNIRQVDPAHYAHIPPHLFRSHVGELTSDVSLNGHEWLQFHRLFVQIFAPDQVVRLNDARVITRRKDKRSMIIMSTEIELEHIFDVDLLEVIHAMFSFSDSTSSEESASSNVKIAPFSTPVVTPKLHGKLRSSSRLKDGSQLSTAVDDDPLADLLRSMNYPLRLLPKPKRFLMKMQMVFVVDENRRIESLILGDGRLPDDAAAALEAKASEWRNQSESGRTI